MKKYIASVSQVVCADVRIEAENEQEARDKILSTGIDPEEYCEGHRATRRIDGIEEIIEHEE
jgi:hypothetical protein